MSEKHRNLPLWMVKSDVNDALRTKKTTRRRRRTVVHWMNEAELVKTAVHVLKQAEMHAGNDGIHAAEAAMLIPETSDSDRDVAEQETVPYDHRVGTESPLKPRTGTSVEEAAREDDEGLDLFHLSQQ